MNLDDRADFKRAGTVSVTSSTVSVIRENSINASYISYSQKVSTKRRSSANAWHGNVGLARGYYSQEGKLHYTVQWMILMVALAFIFISFCDDSLKHSATGVKLNRRQVIRYLHV